MARKSTEYVQFKLRVRESLRRKIEKAAEKRAVSANAEAVERLELSFLREAYQAQKKDMEARDTLIVDLLVGRKGDIAKGYMHALLDVLSEWFEGDTNFTADPADQERQAQQMGEAVTSIMSTPFSEILKSYEFGDEK